MQSWDRQWYGPVAAIRPYLFHKCLVVTVAFDLLVLMIERGGRYGLDAVSFNVPHFAWLDACHRLFLQEGVPNADYYVGVLVITSFFAFCVFLGGHRPWLMAIVALLYTYAWSMSRLDSYLHHYMLSLILGCMVFFPRIEAGLLRDWLLNDEARYETAAKKNRSRKVTSTSRSLATLAWSSLLLGIAYRFSLSRIIDLSTVQRWISMFVFSGLLAGLAMYWNRQQREGVGPVVSSWAVRLLGTTVGVIYIFTSIAKMDMEWCGGHTLRQVGSTADVLLPVEQIAKAMGVPEDTFWAVLASFVIPLELTLAVSYLVAVRQDEPGRVWLRRWCLFGWLLAIGLHLNNEMMDLIIQWFGYYMLLLATLFLLPARFLLTLGVVFIWPECWVREAFERRVSALSGGQAFAATAFVSVLAIAGLLSFGLRTWILGAIIGSVLLTAGLVIVLVYGMVAGWESRSIKISAVALFAGLMMLLAVSQSSLSFDYYDLRGKTLQSIGKAAESIAEMEIAASLPAPSNQAASELHTNLGLSYRQVGEVKKAESHFRTAIGLDQTQFLAHYSLANLLVALQRHDEAVLHYRQAVAIKSDFADAFVNLGNVLEYKDDLDGAIKCYEMALSVEADAQDVKQFLESARAKKSGHR